MKQISRLEKRDRFISISRQNIVTEAHCRLDLHLYDEKYKQILGKHHFGNWLTIKKNIEYMERKISLQKLQKQNILLIH